MAVFVTDGNQRAALAVVRSLGRAGIHVTVGEEQPATLAGSSRHCARRVHYPSAVQDPEAFQEFLVREMQSGRYRVLLPITDVTLLLAAQVRHSLGAVALPVPPAEQLKLAQNKAHMVSLAERQGLACPRTFRLREDEQIEELAKSLTYPAVIKPQFSRFLREGRWVSGEVLFANSAQDLIEHYRYSHGQIPFPLIQETIAGEGLGVFVLLWEGELKAAFCHRRLREKPPWGGVSVYRESVPLDRELVEKSVALLRALEWQGVAMVEYKRDSRNGQAQFMEVNGRFWGSLQLALDAGMDFPLMLYRLATGEKVPAQWEYKLGVKSRWLLGDLDHLWIRLTQSRATNRLTQAQVSRMRACLNFMKLYEPGLHYEVLRLEDPRPGWFECKSYLRDALLPRGSKGSPGAH